MAVARLPRPTLKESRSDEEDVVLDVLARMAPEIPGLTWASNPYFHVGGQRRELDILVIYRGKAFGIEVDGPHHARSGRYAADRSKDLLIENGGLLFVRRIAVEDTRDTAEVRLFLETCLDRLRWFGGNAA